MGGVTNLTLNILMQATDNVSSVISAIGSALTGVLGGPLGAITSAFMGLGTVAVGAAQNFQSTMLQVQALAGVSASQAQAATQAIMQMSVAIGQTPQQLAQGLYYIASAGYNASDSLKLLQVSAQAAAIGNTSTETTANALTAAMSAFNIPASQAGTVMDQFVATVSNGKTEFADFAVVIGSVAVNAKQAGISLTEAEAAFSVLTNVMPSSQQAKDSLDALLQTSSRFDVLTARAQKLGLQFNTNAYESMNLQQRLQYLQQITGGNELEMSKLLGRQNAVAAATVLMTNNFGMYDTVLGKIRNSQGALKTAFDQTSQGMQLAGARLNAAWNVVLITLGTKLLPILTNLMNTVTPLVAGFANFINDGNAMSAMLAHLQPYLPLIGGVLAGIVAGFIAWGVAIAADLLPMLAVLITMALPALITELGALAIELMANPITWIVLAIAAAVALVILVIQHWGQIVAWFTGVWNTFVNWLHTTIDSVFGAGTWNAIGALIQQTWSQIVSATQTAWNVVMGVLQAAWNWFTSVAIPVLQQFAQAVGQYLISVWNAFVTVFTAGWTAAQPVLTALSAAFAALIPAFQQIWATLQTQLGPALASLWTALQNLWATLQPLIVELATTLWQALQALWTLISTQVIQVLQVLWQVIQPILPQLQMLAAIIAGVVVVALGLFLSNIVALVTALATLIKGIVLMFTGLVQFISGALQVIIGVITLFIDLCTGNFTKLGTDLGVIWKGIVTMFQGMWNIIQGVFTATIGTIITLIGTFVKTAITFFTTLYTTLVGHSIIPDLMAAMLAAFTSFVSAATTLWNSWVTATVQLFTTFWQNVTKLFQTALTALVTFLQQTWTNIANTIQTVWNGIVSFLTSIGGKIITAIESPFQTAASNVISTITSMAASVGNTISGIISKASQATSAVKAIPTGGSGGTSFGTTAKPPGFASGIENFMGGLAYVHQGEVLMNLAPGTSVIPARNVHMGGGGTTHYNTFNVSVSAPALSRREASTLAEAVSRELASKYRTQLGSIAAGGSNV